MGYADKRVPLINAELSKHAVAVVPVRDNAMAVDPRTGVAEQGSGTCIRIAGRFFISTAAHVLDNDPKMHALLTPRRTDRLRKIVGGGKRGGGRHDELDVAWLELSGAAAKTLDRHFLPLERMRARCDGRGEHLAFYGAPADDQKKSVAEDGLPVVTAIGSFWATKPLTERADLGYEPELDRRIYLDWPTQIIGHDGEPYPLPEAWGMSGGGIWALNLRDDAPETWRPEYAQLVGIETGWLRHDVPRRHLRGYQMHSWLRMLAEDLPELETTIRPFLDATSLP